MWFFEFIRCLALSLFLCHYVRGEISDELKSAVDGFSAAFDELYPLTDEKTTETAILPEKVEEDEAGGSAQQVVSEQPIFKEVASKKGGTIVMNITEEAKQFARDSLALVDPSLVFRDIKTFTAEVINGIKRTLTIEIENGDQDIKICSIELLEPPGKNTSKVTWNNCSALPSIITDSEVASPPVISDSETAPSLTVDSGVISPSSVDESEPGLPADIEATTPCVPTKSELVSSPPISSGSEVDVTEQQSVDSSPTITENMDGNSDDKSNRRKREAEKTRGFNDIDSKIAEELGRFALSTLDAIDADSNKRVVERIQSAQKELVDGLPLYEIVMLIRETQCPESSEDCTFSTADPQQLCSITLQSSLNNKSPAYARVVKSECNIADPLMISDGKPEKRSVKREQ